MTVAATTLLRALVVEDSEDDVLIVSRELARSGYRLEFERVESADAFERALDREPWDIVLADYVLPGYGGLAALRAVQERGLELPFIVVSGKIGEDTAVEAMRAGAHDYVMKSNLARLAPAVDRELREAGLRRERRRIREQLALKSAALGAAANLILIADGDGRIEWVNQSFETATGYTLDEVRGLPLRRLASSQEPGADDDLWRRVSAGESWHGELVERRRDGSLLTVMQTVTPLRGDDGMVGHVLAIQEDVTEARQAREELAERTLQLERSNRELEDFAYVASHDLSAPLHVIAGYLELFCLRYADVIDAEGTELLEAAVRGTGRMQHLIDDLLSFSRSARATLDRQDVDVADVVRAVLEDFAPQIAASGAEVEVGPMPRLCSVETVLSQVLHNLVGNALKFTGEEPPRIAVSAVDGPEGWRFSVRDNGIGIEPEHVETAFRMFQRVSGGAFEGSGIGLALCRRVVERLGGRIWHEPAPGGGSIFAFTVPDALDVDPSGPIAPGRTAATAAV
jgi:PAS domain S-box-containing protein